MGRSSVSADRRAATAWIRRVFRNHTEPVEVVEQQFNFLPRVFRWRGDLRRVQSVIEVGEQVARGQSRRYFRVVCQDDSRVMLYQDLQLGAWYVRA